MLLNQDMPCFFCCVLDQFNNDISSAPNTWTRIIRNVTLRSRVLGRVGCGGYLPSCSILRSVCGKTTTVAAETLGKNVWTLDGQLKYLKDKTKAWILRWYSCWRATLFYHCIISWPPPNFSSCSDISFSQVSTQTTTANCQDYPVKQETAFKIPQQDVFHIFQIKGLFLINGSSKEGMVILGDCSWTTCWITINLNRIPEDICLWVLLYSFTIVIPRPL